MIPEQVKANAEKRQTKSRQRPSTCGREQQAIKNRVKAAQREVERARAALQPMPDTSKLNAYDLARLCEAKGMGMDHVSNTCVPMGGVEPLAEAELRCGNVLVLSFLHQIRVWACPPLRAARAI